MYKRQDARKGKMKTYQLKLRGLKEISGEKE
jgi:hypothetical protein